MTQKYDIVHLNGEMYMVKKGKYKAHEWAYIYSMNEYAQIGEDMDNDDIAQIIASSSKMLGLPLLPAVEEDVEALAIKDSENSAFDYCQIPAFIRGYKANTKKYTEEDLLKYMELRMEIWKRITKEEVESGRYKKRENPFEWTEKEVHRLAVLALNPKPKQVEVEMEEICGIDRSTGNICDCSERDLDCQFLVSKPRVINGFVNVKRWIL